MRLLFVMLAVLLDVVPYGKAFLNPLQKRDSILIADQLEYGFELTGVEDGTLFAFQDFSTLPEDTLALAKDWKTDTLRLDRKTGAADIRAYVTVAPFEEGEFDLPPIMVQRMLPDGKVDTLLFEPSSFEAFTMPVDTATYVVHDIKGQMTYPVTFAEIAVWLGAALALAALAALIVFLVRRSGRRRKNVDEESGESAYVVALRKLDKFRGNRYWAPDKQKIYYSGITDALKFYMEDRFGVDAPEMTTTELAEAMKGCKDVPEDLLGRVMDLFEQADFVKFAKHVAGDEENASALALAIEFVMKTYTEPEEGPEKDVL